MITLVTGPVKSRDYSTVFDVLQHLFSRGYLCTRSFAYHRPAVWHSLSLQSELCDSSLLLKTFELRLNLLFEQRWTSSGAVVTFLRTIYKCYDLLTYLLGRAFCFDGPLRLHITLLSSLFLSLARLQPLVTLLRSANNICSVIDGH